MIGCTALILPLVFFLCRLANNLRFITAIFQIGVWIRFTITSMFFLKYLLLLKK